MTVFESEVHAALDQALSNGWDFRGWSPIQVARDLIMYHIELCDEEPEDLTPAVLSWQLKHPL